MLHRFHPRARFWQHPTERRHKPKQQKRQRKPKPKPSKNRQRSNRRQDKRRTKRRPHERPGAGRRDERGKCARPKCAASATCRGKLPTHRKPAKFKQSRQIKRDGRDEHEQHKDNARLLQLECPANSTAARAQPKQSRTKPHTHKDDPSRISQRLAPRFAFIAARLRKAQRFQADNRKHARHNIEDQPAKQRTTKRKQNRGQPDRRTLGFNGLNDGRSSSGHCAGNSLDEQPFIRANRKHTFKRSEHAPRSIGFDDQHIAVAANRLRRDIADRVLAHREQPRVGDGRVCRERHREPRALALDFKTGFAAKRTRQFRAPAIKLRTRGGRDAAVPHGQINRHITALRHANLVSTAKPIAAQLERKPRPLRQPRRDGHRN